MLNYPPLEKLLPKAENRYILAMLAAKRARQIVDGANPLVATKTPNPVTLACEELGSDKIQYRHGIYQPHIPLRPEIEARRLAEELEDREKRAQEMAEEARRTIERDHRLGIQDSEVAEELGGESFTSDDAAALARKLIMAVEAQDEAERLEAASRADEADRDDLTAEEASDIEETEEKDAAADEDLDVAEGEDAAAEEQIADDLEQDADE